MKDQKFGAIGRARINGEWKSIVACKDVKRGREQGKVEVTYWALRTARIPKESVRFFNGER